MFQRSSLTLTIVAFAALCVPAQSLESLTHYNRGKMFRVIRIWERQPEA